MDAECTFLGMSVGPYRVVVAGPKARVAIPSAVGWPKDSEARSKVGAPAIFGEGLLLHRPLLNLVRPFQHWIAPSPTDSTERQYAAKQLLEHVVSLGQPRSDRPVFAAMALPHALSDANRVMLQLATRDALDSIVCVSEPKAIAVATGRAELAMIVDIGGESCDLFLVNGDNVQALPGLAMGTDAIDESIRLTARRLSIDIPTSALLRSAYDRDEIGTQRSDELGELFAAGVNKIASPLADAITRAIGMVPADRQIAAQANVVLAGAGARLVGLSAALMSRLGSSVMCVTDSLYASAEGARMIAESMGMELWRQTLRPQPVTTENRALHAGHAAIPVPKAAAILRRMTG